MALDFYWNKFKTNTSTLFLFSFCAFSLLTYDVSAQEYEVSVFPNRLRFSYETLAQDDEADLGFMGAGLDVFSISRKLSSLYFGIHSYGTMAGERPGLITLGISSGLRLPILKKHKLFVDFGMFVGAGGGGGADDGGGLILRPHFNLEKQFGSIGVNVGFSRIDFPTGTVSGNQFNVGFTINSRQFFKAINEKIKATPPISVTYSKIRFAVVGTSYFNLDNGSVGRDPNAENGNIGLAGIQVEKDIVKENLYGIFKINGALSGGVDGYMSILFGFGGKLPVKKHLLNLESRVVFGPSGGGAVNSGGGAIMQAEAGLSIEFTKSYYLKVMTGKTFSPWGALDTNHLEFGIGKTLNSLSPKLAKNQDNFTVSKDAHDTNHLSFAVFNRTYFGLEGLAKTNEPYLPNFNLLGFEIKKYLNDKWSINGATVWAYQGDYGAYAEGLLGAAYHQTVVSNFKLVGKAYFGAAGGGGIDVGSGLIFQYNLGAEYALNKTIDAFVSVGKFQPLNGNFEPYILDAGIQIHLYPIFGKSKR